MARIGGTSAGGVCRLALTDEDRRARDLFVDWCRQAHCDIRIDQIGNIFARRRGTEAGRAPVAMGSHLDSQPTGGKFDGVYGVLAGLEVIRTLNDRAIPTRAPVEVVAWSSEEGARFNPAMIGSGVFSGALPLESILNAQDRADRRYGSELQRIGYSGDRLPEDFRPGAHLELHIEQGPHLEAAGRTIGVVSGVQGICWYDVLVHGQATHAGPVTMAMRRDPVKTAAALISGVYEFVDRCGPEARGTIGVLGAEPGSRNTVPHTVRFSVDLRHAEARRLNELDAALKQLAQRLSSPGVSIEVKDVWKVSPVVFDSNCVTAVRSAAASLDLSHQDIVSGAGHDSVYLARVCPTAMIFIPCAEGLSHNEAESATPDDVTAGANVLLHACLQLAGFAN